MKFKTIWFQAWAGGCLGVTLHDDGWMRGLVMLGFAFIFMFLAYASEQEES